MPSRLGGYKPLLPFFSSSSAAPASSASAIFLPRACLSPRIFLSCILVTFTISWLLLYSYSHFSFGFRYGSSGAIDNEDWAALERASTRTMHWQNSTLVSRFHCGSSPTTSTSIRGSGFNRETICTVQNLCVDAERGAWIHLEKGSDDFPLINIVSADPKSDSYYRPAVLDYFPPTGSYRFIDETIFLYGQNPTNRRTWTLNNLLPLHSIMSSYGGTRSSWFMRVQGKSGGNNAGAKQKQNPQSQQSQDEQDVDLDTTILAPSGREIVLDSRRTPASGYYIGAPSSSLPTCFSKAVIGLQSRCTRPHCENLIGGEELVQSLRAKILDHLAPAMIHFQKTDTSIIHPVIGENVPTVHKSNLTLHTGETAPRSRIQVALLGRYGNTSIPNAMALELALLRKGFSVKTIHLDYPQEIGMAQSAQLFKDQNILVAPQGEGLGYSEWMNPGTVVISVLPRFTRSSKIYTDRMMAFGKRFLAWDCTDETCVQPDRDLAHECIETVPGADQERITAADFEDFANMKVDFRQRSAVWKLISDCYSKDVSRRINVDELSRLVESLAVDFKLEERKQNEDDLRHHRRADGEDEGEDEDQDMSGEEDEEDVNKEDAALIQNKEEGDTVDEDAEDGGEEEDINVHEYDTPKGKGKGKQEEAEGEDSEEPQSESEEEPEDVEESEDAQESEDGDGTSDEDAEESKETAQETTEPEVKDDPASLPTNTPSKVIAGNAYTDQDAVPQLSFAEFCSRGKCCGSVKAAKALSVGDARGITPCAASMSAIVFGPLGVWGQTGQPASSRESQSLVWQVDLSR